MAQHLVCEAKVFGLRYLTVLIISCNWWSNWGNSATYTIRNPNIRILRCSLMFKIWKLPIRNSRNLANLVFCTNHTCQSHQKTTSHTHTLISWPKSNKKHFPKQFPSQDSGFIFLQWPHLNPSGRDHGSYHFRTSNDLWLPILMTMTCSYYPSCCLDTRIWQILTIKHPFQYVSISLVTVFCNRCSPVTMVPGTSRRRFCHSPPHPRSPGLWFQAPKHQTVLMHKLLGDGVFSDFIWFYLIFLLGKYITPLKVCHPVLGELFGASQPQKGEERQQLHGDNSKDNASTWAVSEPNPNPAMAKDDLCRTQNKSNCVVLIFSPSFEQNPGTCTIYH